jgi:hypothetical protein
MAKVKRRLGYSHLSKARRIATKTATERALDAALARAPAGGGKAARKARLEVTMAHSRRHAAAAARPPRLSEMSAMLSALDDMESALNARVITRATRATPKNKAALAAAVTFSRAGLVSDPLAALSARMAEARVA